MRRSPLQAAAARVRAQWLARVRPEVLLGVAGMGLAGFWLSTGVPAVAAFGLALAATAGLVPGRRPGARVALGALALYGALEHWAPGLPLTYERRLLLEIVAATLPFAWALGAGTAAVTGRARTFRTVAAGAAAVGGILRIVEVYLLWPSPGTEATIRYSLRVDVAYVIWAVAAILLALAAVLARQSRGRSARAVGVVMLVVLLLVPAVDVGAAVGVSVSQGHGLSVGVHAEDVAEVRTDVFDFVHLDVSWGRVEREEGVRNWTAYDQRIRDAEERGVPVYLLVSTYPPRWVVEKYPNAVMMDEDGDPFYWIDEKPGTPRKRVWDVSFHHEPSARGKLDFLHAAVERYADSPAVEVVAVLNEPSYPSDWNLLRWASYDPYSVDAFREDLHHEAEGNLTLLNERYGTAFETWAEVEPPGTPFGAFGGRWQEFREDALVEHTHRFVSEARLVTEKPVTVKIAAHYVSRFAIPQTGLSDRAVRAMASMSDVVSVDLYPVSTADLIRSLEYYRSLAGEKPLYVSEFNLAFGPKAPLAGAQLLVALAALDRHADAVVLFTLDDHFLYELSTDSPVYAALTLFRAQPGSLEFPAALAVLVGADVRNVGRNTLDVFRMVGQYAGGAIAAAASAR